MASKEQPKFKGPDGKFREGFVFSTTDSHKFFTGSIDVDTVEMQVSIRGGVFTSDPDLVLFEGDNFIVPNPSAYPNGLEILASDSNRVEIRSIFTSGEASDTSFIESRLVLEEDLKNVVEPPTDLRIQCFDGYVALTVRALANPKVVGYNFYASISPGGGLEGYQKINAGVFSAADSIVQIEDREIGRLEVDSRVTTDAEGNYLSEKQYLNFVGTQNGVVEMPDPSDPKGEEKVSVDQNFNIDLNESFTLPSGIDKFRTQIIVQSVSEINTYTFNHQRNGNYTTDFPSIPNSDFMAIDEKDPIYYVATAVYYDEDSGQQLESPYSIEVAGHPLNVTSTVGSLPTIARSDMLKSMAASIHRSNPAVKIEPGSVLRDLIIDPILTEAERMRFIMDFFHRAQSFTLLLEIDDPLLSGESVPVSNSSYKQALKQALYLSSEEQVQSVINSAFERLAYNFGLLRRNGRRARGEVTFYVTSTPTTSIGIPIGTIVSSGGVDFRVTSSGVISASTSAVGFNPITGKYSITLAAQATAYGSSGNVSAGAINSIKSSGISVFVTNEMDMIGGSEVESNYDLAVRAQGALASVDSGTLQGYTYNISDVPGVVEAKVITPGDDLMFRDYDLDAGAHRGGKVDIYVRGIKPSTVKESFAFQFSIAKDIQFEVYGSPGNLEFRSVDPNISSENPIIEMLHYSMYGYRFRNETSGETFDLTDVEIVDYNIIRLSSAYNDPTAHAVTDVIMGDYRYRTSNRHVFKSQPVVDITSMEGETSGVLNSNLYALYKEKDPLKQGNSYLAEDCLRVIDSEASEEGISIPSPTPLTMSNEAHILVGTQVDYLGRLGINPISIRVADPSSGLEFTGPYLANNLGIGADFEIVFSDDPSYPIGIHISESSTIQSGSQVYVSYSYDENFSVEYETNALIRVAQNAIDDNRHITADVLVKGTSEVGVNVSATVVLRQGYNPSSVDSKIQSSLVRLFEEMTLGKPLRQSDVIEAIDRVEGVSYVIVPITTLAVEEGASFSREPLYADSVSSYCHIEQWSSSTTDCFLIYDSLDYATSDMGGEETVFRAVFQDYAELNIQSTRPNVNGVPLRNQAGNSFIIGSEGMIIPGFNDEETLLFADSFLEADEIAAKQVEVSANRILVSLPKGKTPADYNWSVTYTSSGSEGVSDIDPGPTEMLTLGQVEMVYDEDNPRGYRERTSFSSGSGTGSSY